MGVTSKEGLGQMICPFCPFLKIERDCPDFGKKCLNIVLYMVGWSDAFQKICQKEAKVYSEESANH